MWTRVHIRAHTNDTIHRMPVVSHYFTNLQVVVSHEDMLQGNKKEDCKQVNMDVNDALLKILKVETQLFPL